MLRFYVSGSANIPYVANSTQKKIENLIENNYKIILGDNYGYEVLLQNFISLKKYKNVKIYTNNKFAKNNVDNWEIQSCYQLKEKTKNYSNFHKNYNPPKYIKKEKLLIQDCHYGLIAFDGKDINTYNTIINLLKNEKPIIIYLHYFKKYFLFEKLNDFFSDKEFNTLFNKKYLK